MGMVVTLFLALGATTVAYASRPGRRRRRPDLLRRSSLIGATIRVFTARAPDATPQARVATTCRYSGSSTSARSPAVFASSR